MTIVLNFSDALFKLVQKILIAVSYTHRLMWKKKAPILGAFLLVSQLASPLTVIIAYAAPTASNDVGSSASLDPVGNKAARLQTQGSSGVDQVTGAFTYSYPLTIPDGRNGMAPKLALSYNSQNTDSGWFGYNWMLSIPYIERTSKTGTDKIYTSPAFVSALHGELISNNGTSYEQKVDDGSYAKYTFTGASWQMIDRDGTTYYFGNSYTSRIQDDSGTKIGKWYLTEVRDKFGNGIIYTYIKDSGTVYPQSISYTEHALAHAANLVNFTLEAKPDALINYRYGFRTVDTKRVASIKVVTNGKDNSYFAFTYTKGSNSNRSLIQSVEEKHLSTNDDWTLLPKTSFEYENSPVTISGTITTSTNPYGTNNIVMDTNADGIQDIYNAGTGYYPADINGDYKKDIVYSDMTYGTPSNGPYIFFKYNQGGTFLTRLMRDIVSTTGFTYMVPAMVVPPLRWMNAYNGQYTQESAIVDINGDGFEDVVYNDPYGGNGVAINTAQSTFDYSQSSNLSFNVLNDQVIDINGDGLQDKISKVYSATSTLFNTYLNNGSGYASTSDFVYDAKVASSTYDIGVRFSDINNDGLPDAVRSYASNSTGGSCPVGQILNEILINTGTGFAASSSTLPGYLLSYTSCAAGSGTREFDTNGDLTTDYDGAINNTPKQDILKKVTSPLGSTLETSYTWTTKTGLNPNLPVPMYIVATTTEKLLSSDQNPHAVGYSFYGGQMYFDSATPRDHKFAGFAHVDVVNGTTKTATYYHQGNGDDYATGEKGDSYYNIGRSYRTDVFDSSSGSPVLFSKSLSLYTTYTFASSSFTYLESQVVNGYNSDGSYISSASKNIYDETKRLIKTSYNYGDIDPFISFASSTVSDKGTDNVITTYQYSSVRPQRLVKQKSTDYSGNTLVGASYYYDGLPLGLVDKGALTSTVSTLYKNDGIVATTTTSQTVYDATGNVIQSIDPLNRSTYVTYDSSYLYPVTKVDPLNGMTTYSYDPYTLSLISTKGPDSISSIREVDGLGKVVRSYTKSSAGGIYNDVKAVYVYGNGLSVYTVRSNINGDPSRTLEKYDSYGRITQSKVETSKDLFLTQDTNYDAKGNIQSLSLPYTTSGYGFTTDVPSNGKTVYTYDALGRVVTKQSFGSTLTYQYGARSLTVFDNASTQHKKVYGYDANSNLVSVTEYNGGQPYTTTYTYTPLSKLSRITDANGNIRNFSYRSDGSLVYQEDPHAVTDTTYTTYDYSYDGLGNLLVKSGPLGAITYTYDNLNRPTKRVVGHATNGTSTLTITYTGCNNNYLAPCVLTRDTSSTTYSYDPSGKLASDSLSIDGNSFTRSYTYDSFSNPLTITYPDNGKVTYTYSLDGKQSSLIYTTPSGSIKTIVAGETYNSLGQVDSRTYGNGVRMCNGYTNQSGDGAISPRLGKSTYLFNTGGCVAASNQIELYKDEFTYKDSLTPSVILTTYKDIVGVSHTKSDSFTYDNLARLTGVTTSYDGGQANTESLVYDPVGNILKDNDVLYRYSKDGQQNAHAVTSIGGTHIDYDAQGNRIRVGDNQYTWNTLNQMLSASTTNGTEFYTYDENGERIKKVVKANTQLNQKATPAQATSTLNIFRTGDLLAAVATSSTYLATSSYNTLSSLGLLSTSTLSSFVDDIYGSPFVSKFCAISGSSSARQVCTATTTRQILANTLNSKGTSTVSTIGLVNDIIGVITGQYLIPSSYTSIATSSIATSSPSIFAIDSATINAYNTYVGTGIVVSLAEYANLPLISTSTYTTLSAIGYADTSRVKALMVLAGCTTTGSPCTTAEKVVFEKIYKEKGYLLSDKTLQEMWYVYSQKARIPTSGTDLTATSTFLALSSIPTVSGITTNSATSTYTGGAYFTTEYNNQNTAEPRLPFIATIPYYVSQSVFTELQQAGITQSTLDTYQALINDVFNIRVASSSDYMMALSLFASYDKKVALSSEALKELYLDVLGAAVIPGKVDDYTALATFDITSNMSINSYLYDGYSGYWTSYLSSTCDAGRFSYYGSTASSRCVITMSPFSLAVATSSTIKYVLSVYPTPTPAEVPIFVSYSYFTNNSGSYSFEADQTTLASRQYASIISLDGLRADIDVTPTINARLSGSTTTLDVINYAEYNYIGKLSSWRASSVALKAYASTPRLTLASTTLNSNLSQYFTTGTSTQIVATTSVVSYYKLNNSVSDEVNGNNGTATGITYGSAIIDNSASFNGSSSYIDFGVPASLNISGNITLSAWVKTNQGSGTEGAIISNYNSVGSKAQYQMKLYNNGSAIKLIYNINNTAQQTITSTSNIPTNTWTHVTASNDGTNVRFYINGALDSTTAVNQTPPTTGYGNTSLGRAGSYNGVYYNGSMDEVSIWGRVLSQTEVINLYNNGIGLQYPFSQTSQLISTGSTAQIKSSFSSYFAEIYDSSSVIATSTLNATTTKHVISLESQQEFVSTTLRDAYDLAKVFMATSTPWCVADASTTECDKQARKTFFRTTIGSYSGFIPSQAATEEFWMVYKGLLVLPDTVYASTTNAVINPPYWATMSGTSSLPTGGTIATTSAYRIHTFTTSGTFTSPFNLPVEVLVVGGGGNGGSSNNTANGGAGGGAGQVATSSSYLATTSVSVIIGQATQSSLFGSVVAIMGNNGANQGGVGGSSGNSFVGGGNGGGGEMVGGGAGATSNGVAGNSSTLGGGGGQGYTSSISGTSSCYAGGGGGTRSGIGACGGGNGGYLYARGNDATANTGSGGGGSGIYNAVAGANGGSGIVILRYPFTTGTTTQIYVGTTTAYVQTMNSSTTQGISITRSLLPISLATSTATTTKNLNLVPPGLLSDLQYVAVYSTSTFALATTTKIVSEDTYNELLNTPIRINSDVDTIFDYAFPYATSTCPGQAATSSCVVTAQKGKVKTTIANLAGFNLSDAALEELYQVKTNLLSVIPINLTTGTISTSSQFVLVPLITSSAFTTFATTTVGTSTMVSSNPGTCSLGTVGATSSQCYLTLPYITSSVATVILSLDMATSSIASSSVSYTETSVIQDTSTSTNATAVPVFITTAITSSALGQKGSGATFTYDIGLIFKVFLNGTSSRLLLTPSVSATSTTISNAKLLMSRTITTPRIAYASSSLSSQFAAFSRASIPAFATTTSTTTVDLTSAPELIFSTIFLSPVDDINSGAIAYGSTSVPTSSLLAYYAFEGNSNSSIGSLNGINNNSPTYSLGKLGSALTESAASSQYVSLPNGVLPWGTNTWSVNMWVKMNTTGGNQSWMMTGRTGQGLLLYKSGTNTIDCAKPNVVSTPYTWTGMDTNWHMWTCTSDSTGMKLYLDGNSTPVATNANTSPLVNPGNDTMEVGGYRSSGTIQSGWYSDGKIDGLGIWSVALSTTSIAQLYASGAGFEYPFQQQVVSGTSTPNQSGNYIDTIYSSLPTVQPTLNQIVWPLFATSSATTTLFASTQASTSQQVIYTPNSSYSFNQTTGIITTYFTLNGVLIGSYNYKQGNEAGTSKLNFVHTNYLGTPVLETDDKGDIVQMDITDMFGNYIQRDQRNDNAYHNKGYTSHEFDDVTGLTYAKARYLDTPSHSFLSVDPVIYDLSQDYLNDPQQMNSYAYARNNPIVYKDPNGQWIESGLDIAFLAYDLKDLQESRENGTASWKNYAYIAGDGVGLALPGITGVGMGMRAVGRGDDAYKAFNGAKQVVGQAAQSPGLLQQNQILGKIGEGVNPRVENMIKSVFRSEDKLPGGTFGAIKNEIQTGQKTGNVNHAVNKAPQTVSRINNILTDFNRGKETLKPIEVKILNDFKNSFNKLINTWKNLKK